MPLFLSECFYYFKLELHMYLCYLRYFKRMVHIFSSQPFYTKYICQPTSYDQSSHPLYHNKKLWPFFQHALGAIDGSHIHCSPPVFYWQPTKTERDFYRRIAFLPAVLISSLHTHSQDGRDLQPMHGFTTMPSTQT